MSSKVDYETLDNAYADLRAERDALRLQLARCKKALAACKKALLNSRSPAAAAKGGAS